MGRREERGEARRWEEGRRGGKLGDGKKGGEGGKLGDGKKGGEGGKVKVQVGGRGRGKLGAGKLLSAFPQECMSIHHHEYCLENYVWSYDFTVVYYLVKCWCLVIKVPASNMLYFHETLLKINGRPSVQYLYSVLHCTLPIPKFLP